MNFPFYIIYSEIQRLEQMSNRISVQKAKYFGLRMESNVMWNHIQIKLQKYVSLRPTFLQIFKPYWMFVKTTIKMTYKLTKYYLSHWKKIRS
jgi:hypothetical protein